MCFHLWAKRSWLGFKGAGKFEGCVSLRTGLSACKRVTRKRGSFENFILNCIDFVTTKERSPAGSGIDLELFIHALPEVKLLVRAVHQLSHRFWQCSDVTVLTAAMRKTFSHFLTLYFLVQSRVICKGPSRDQATAQDGLPCPRQPPHLTSVPV